MSRIKPPKVPVRMPAVDRDDAVEAQCQRGIGTDNGENREAGRVRDLHRPGPSGEVIVEIDRQEGKDGCDAYRQWILRPENRGVTEDHVPERAAADSDDHTQHHDPEEIESFPAGRQGPADRENGDPEKVQDVYVCG